MRWSFLALPTLFALAGATYAVGPNDALNDTGISKYGDATQNNLTTEPATYPGQDASRGRDAAAAAGTLVKIGGGKAGFDFTKIANNGSALPASAALGTGATAWGCTQDNVTGLMWEVKVNNPAHLRHMGHTYSWYDSNPATNGGDVGWVSLGSCQVAGRCDAPKFVQDVNAAGLCGHSDWRMPGLKELLSIVDYSVADPAVAIDSNYFPNTSASQSWSASAYAYNPTYAWYVEFSSGIAGNFGKFTGNPVRLVRSEP